MGLLTKIKARVARVPEEWYDRDRLSDWEARHADMRGDVWAVAPIDESWCLYRPGSPNRDGYSYPYDCVAPTAERPNDCGDRFTLDDVREWMVPWVESVAGGTVVDTAEGWQWFGWDRSQRAYIAYFKVST